VNAQVQHSVVLKLKPVGEDQLSDSNRSQSKVKVTKFRLIIHAARFWEKRKFRISGGGISPRLYA